jgi:serine/threonine-protein kinase
MTIDGRNGRDPETPLPGVSGQAHPEPAAWREVSIIERLPLQPPPANPRPSPVRFARGTEPPPDTLVEPHAPTEVDPVATPEATPVAAPVAAPVARPVTLPPSLPPRVDLDFTNVRLRRAPDYAVWVAAFAGFAIATLIFLPRGGHEDRARESKSGEVNVHVTEAVEVEPEAPPARPEPPSQAVESTPREGPRAQSDAQAPKRSAPARASKPARKARARAAPAKRSAAPEPKHAKPPKPRRAAAPAKRTSAKPGFLTLDARPYATIYLDGRKIGNTPIIEKQLTPGKHQVRAVSPDGTVRRFRVVIQSGETVRRRIPSSQ